MILRLSLFLREGPCSQGASWAVCGSRVLPYDLLICMMFLTASFARETVEKWLDLKSLNGQTKVEVLGTPCPQLLSLRVLLNQALQVEPFCRGNLYKIAEPRVHRGATNPLLNGYGRA